MQWLNDLCKPSYKLDIEVPYLCAGPYDGGTWLSYPERQGVTLSHIRDREFQKYDPAHLASVLQNWFFFGLLKAILPAGVCLKEQDLIQTDKTRNTTVTTTALPGLLRKWYALQRRLPAEERLAQFQNNAKILSEISTAVFSISNYPEDSQTDIFPSLPRQVALSCAVLGETLMVVNQATLNPNHEFGHLDGDCWGNGSFFLEHMETQGWCPFVVSGVEKNSSLLLKHYLATIGPPLVKRNHRRCSDYKCSAPDFLPKTVQHTTHNCKCSLLEIDIKDLGELIVKEKTPLTQLVSDAGGPRLVLQEAKEPMRYVAISHVWTDGLGNPEKNSMPLCQLRRIQEAANSLYGPSTEHDWERDRETPSIPTWFWIDTLCVPNEQNHKDLNDRALPRMKEIYVLADKVLVLDSEVAACVESTDRQILLARICLSNWIRRLWTLQEGYFAKDLLFLVDKAAISIRDILRDAMDEGLPPPLNQLSAHKWKEVEGKFLTIFHRSASIPLGHLSDQNKDIRESDPEPDEENIARVLRELALRTSKFDKDEAGCLAFLLNVDTKSIASIQKAPESERIKELLKLLDARAQESFKRLDAKEQGVKLRGCIPPGVVLLPGERINIDGYRWAPRSFMMGPDNTRHLITHRLNVPLEYPSSELMLRSSGTLCEYGLRIQFPGLILGEVREDGPMSQFFIVDTLKGRKFSRSNAVEEVPGRPPATWQVMYSMDVHDQSWQDIAPNRKKQRHGRSTTENMAIIIFSYGPAWKMTAEGILVRTKQRLEDGAMAVSRVCRLLISGTPEYDDHHWMRQPSNRINGDWLPVHQVWCVD